MEKFDLGYWKLSEMDSMSQYPLDFRFSQSIEKNTGGTVHDLEKYLKRTYSRNVTAEFEHVVEEQERIWLYDQYETFLNDNKLSEVTAQEKIKALQLLTRAEQMELFLQKRFATHKRYSGEGSEALMIAINTLLA